MAGARRARALELRAQGWTYQAIADELGYTSPGTVHHIVSAALAAQTAEDVEEFRGLERDRLDALQVPLWKRAMAGDVVAARQVRLIIEQRIRLLGLDKLQPETELVKCVTVVCRCPPGTGHHADDTPL